ncbi:P-loop containing nucleoside triphosphate hydrolase protein [Limtongia smithiae]|uniref:P-loop containing nucleoside triphosphate hydrolase protein n=1 Tax=Limtongia smithiae TaxID=1125753 RepID=UPI0034CD32F8
MSATPYATRSRTAATPIASPPSVLGRRTRSTMNVIGSTCGPVKITVSGALTTQKTGGSSPHSNIRVVVPTVQAGSGRVPVRKSPMHATVKASPRRANTPTTVKARTAESTIFLDRRKSLAKRKAECVEDSDDELSASTITVTPPVTPTKRGSRRERDDDTPKSSGNKASVKKSSSDHNKENIDPICGQQCLPAILPPTPSSLQSTRSASTPLTPVTPTSSSSIYTGVKAIFQRSTPSSSHLLSADGSAHDRRMLGRDKERTELSGFLTAHLDNGTSGALYISGPPGTGKSALTNEVLRGLVPEYNHVQRPSVGRSWSSESSEDVFNDVENVKVATVNCMTVRRPTLVVCNILKELTGAELFKDTALDVVVPELERLFTNSTKSYVVVLDEVDYLLTKEQDMLYTIFDWTRLPGSKLVLVGIANALNFTARFLPKLKARNFTPSLLRFTPYTAEQIASVISSRLSDFGAAVSTTTSPRDQTFARTLIHPAAIQLCARKTAANTGDLRKAFDICRRCLDLAEDDARRKFASSAVPPAAVLVETSSSPTKSATAAAAMMASSGPLLIPEDATEIPRVTIAHVAKVCATAFGGSTVQRIKALNLQQKAVLCAVVVGEKQRRTDFTTMVFAGGAKSNQQSMSVSEVYELYNKLCAKDKLLDRLKIGEFRDVVNALEACGSVTLSSTSGSSSSSSSSSSATASGSGAAGDRRISAAVQEIDLLRAIEDVGLLKRFLV